MRISVWKRVIAACMMAVMAFMLPSMHVYGATDKQTTYVKNFKLFIKKDGTFEDAKNWCESQTDGDWHAADGNINDGAEGKFKSKMAVFVCYETTTDRAEAVTDIAVMNERGNYSEGEYKRILGEQVQMYKDMVSDMKTMLEEYRKNVNAGVPTALQAKKLLDKYVEDDSGEKLGELLMHISDDDLAKILMQANGQAVLLIDQQLAYACDTANNTWLDRMQQLGKSGNAYGKLRERFLKAYNNDANKADRALRSNYEEPAEKIAEGWGVFSEHLKKMLKYAKDNGLDQMEGDEQVNFLRLHVIDADAREYLNELGLITSLAEYQYENGTMMDFLTKDVSEVTGEGITALYPLVASLTDGQIAALDQTTDLFTLASNALCATAYNGYSEGMAKQFGAENKKEAADLKSQTDEVYDTIEKSETTSIYEGIDRDIYGDGGVAVTGVARNYSEGKDGSWTDALLKNGVYTGLTIGLTAGAALSLTGAIVCGVILRNVPSALDYYGKFGHKVVSSLGKDSAYLTNFFKSKEEMETVVYLCKNYGYKTIMNDCTKTYRGMPMRDVIVSLENIGGNKIKNISKIINALKYGASVFFVLLSVADVALTVYKLYDYYHVEHIDIPHHMVDVVYNENAESSYIAYKAVPDQDGNAGDVNGGGGKQWLALYQTHDEGAGDPIVAPETGEDFKFMINTGSPTLTGKSADSYSPLHMFGTPEVPQNLTFADGDNGYSYADKNGGTYLFFRRDDGAGQTELTTGSFSEGADVGASQANDGDGTGTAISPGIVALAGAAGLVAGGIIGGLISNARRKRHYFLNERK